MLNHFYDESEKDMTDNVHNRFLLAQLLMDSFRDKLTVRDVKSALRNLPQGSDAYDVAYHDAMERIFAQGDGPSKMARKILVWILCAHRPLSTLELLHALAVEPGDTEIDEENIMETEQLLTFCTGLVTIDEQSGSVRFTHYTTQDYLRRYQHMWLPHAEIEIFRSCTAYLSFNSLAAGPCSSRRDYEYRLKEFVLLEYAAVNWGHHLHQLMETSFVDLSDEITAEALSLLLDTNRVSAMSQVLFMSKRSQRSTLPVRDEGEGFSGSHWIARFGLLPLLEQWIERKYESDQRDSSGRTPLSWAAGNGREATVKLLLETGKVDVDSKDNNGLTPLSWAAGNGQEAIAKLLLDSGNAYPDSRDNNGRTPLSLAAESGHEATVKMLLSTGNVDVDWTDIDGRSALSLAAANGHDAIVKLLLGTDKVDPTSISLSSKDSESNNSTDGTKKHRERLGVTLSELTRRLHDGNNQTRLESAQALGRQSPLTNSAIAALATSLQDEELGVRSVAAQALGRQSNLPESAIAALAVLLQDEDSGARSAAAQALRGQSNLPESAITALVMTLQDEEASVRYVAAGTLSRQASLPESAITAIVTLLQDKESDVRSAAAEALGRQSSLSESANTTLTTLLKDKESIVRSVAVKAIGRQSVPYPSSRDDFAIAIICVLPEERDTVEALMTRDYKYEGQRYGQVRGDDNSYTVGELGGKPVVLMAPRDMGTTNTRDLARGLRISFPNITYAFVVGIAGGAPFVPEGSGWKASDIHLGDVIVGTRVIEYDFGREYENGFKRRTNVESMLPHAPTEVTNFVNQFVRGRGQAFKRILRKTNADLADCSGFEVGEKGYHEHPGPDKDDVYDLGYRHKHQDPGKCAQCSQCTEWYHEVCKEALSAGCQELGCMPHHCNPVRDTKIHFGRYASGNAVMKSGHRRDLLIREEGVIGFEMEGTGAWEVFETIVVKGVVDYADSHENKHWRGYPAARAALCAAAMIEEIELPDRPHVGQ
jgi:ankyrin repeat protein/nucleoside phosphorylase